jgi:ComF family protein
LEKLKINIIYRKVYNKYYDEMIYLFKYKDVRNLILKYKFNNKAFLSNTFSKIILKNKNLCRNLKFYDIIIPVPMYKIKKQKRGYNQTELITKKIAKNLGIYEDSKVLLKIKNTRTQSKLNEKQRYENIKNVFFINNIEKIKDKKIILFDDIITTGATINECAKILKQNGAKSVVVLALAKD